MEDRGIHKLKARLYCKATEIILAALLTVAIAVFAWSINAQAEQAIRLRKCEIETALNTERNEATMKALKEGDKNLSKQIDSVVDLVNQRFDTFEKMLNLVLDDESTGGK